MFFLKKFSNFTPRIIKCQDIRVLNRFITTFDKSADRKSFIHEDPMVVGEEEMSESPSPPRTTPTTTTATGSKKKQNFQEINKTVIAGILGVSETLVRKPPKKQIVQDLAQDVYTVLQSHGFAAGEVLCYPDIFMMSPWAVTNYIEIMNESLFASVELAQILNFTVLQKKSVELLRDVKIIPTVPEIVQSYFDVLKMTKNTLAEDSVWNALPVDTGRLTLKELRQIVIIQYVAWKLDCNHKDVEPIIPKYSRVSHRSLNWIKQSLELLMTESNLGAEKILKHGYLLQSNPENTADILRNIHSLSGIPMTDLLHKRPKILMSPKSSLLEIEDLFHKHEIRTDSLMKHPELFTLSPTTLQERLEQFDTVPEFLPLKKHPRVSRLIYYQNKAKQRVDYFRSVNITGASLHLLSMDKTKFKKHVSTGEVRNRGRDIITFLKTYLDRENLTSKDIRINIQRQPHWLHSTVMTVKETLQFLDSFNVFTKSQILSALPIALYPKEKIEKHFQAVLDSKEAQITDEYFLHMVLYNLEKVVHFSGDGIWLNNIPENIDDDHHPTRLDLYLEQHGNTPNRRNETINETIENEEIVFGESLQETLNGDVKKE